MTIQEAKICIEEAIMRANECQQPFRCRWHHRFSAGVKQCPYNRRHDCACHRYARALHVLLGAAVGEDKP